MWPNEVLGILFSGMGVLLLLSLISFSPHDLPKIPVIGDGSGGCVNWIGPLGVLVAHVTLWTFGAASYLIAVTLLWMGVAKLIFDARVGWRTWAH